MNDNNILNGTRVKDIEFSLSNEKGARMEFKAKIFSDLAVYTLLNYGQLTRDLIQKYLEKYEKALKFLRKNNYKIIGGAELRELILPENFTEKELIALSNSLASIVQNDTLISVGLNNFRERNFRQNLEDKIEYNSQNILKDYYNKYTRFLGLRTISSERKRSLILSVVSDVENARNIASEIVGSQHVNNTRDLILSLGYQVIFNLPREELLMLPKEREDLETFLIKSLDDINPNI